MRKALCKHTEANGMIDWKMFAVCLFAIAASYLIASIPVAQAAQVTISYAGNPPMTATYSPETYINKQVSVNGDGNVRIQVSNSSANSIESAYIYKCEERGPSECAEHITPVYMAGNVDVTYAWNNVSDSARQTANIMLIVRTADSSGGRWLSFWSHGTKSAGNPYSMIDSSISSILITAKNIDVVPNIKSFIDAKGMLPMNPLWISSIAFYGAANLHKVDMSSPPVLDARSYYTGNSTTSIGSTYEFVFPYNGIYTLNGIVVANSSNYIIGDGVCSASESADLIGCLDCGTDAGYYCDTAVGRKQLSGISVSTTASPIKVSNCNAPNTVSLSFTITGMPTGTSVTGAQYSLNGSAAHSTTCSSAGGNIFACSITTPAVAGCSGTDYVLSPNSMTLDLKFRNASSYMTASRSAQIPTITAGSWACGQYGCETSLGESQANCCYDCGCAAGNYCDFAAGRPETSSCKLPVSASSIQFASASPLNFYTHNSLAGDNVQMEVRVLNAPRSISISSVGCRVGDCLKSGLPCSASCGISCSQQASGNPNMYNSTCAMNFKIQGYDALQNYSIYPVISHSMTYNNGTGNPVSSAIDANAPVISVGSHWKGDGKCDPDESYATSCFDCPCPSGQYCNTANHAKFTPGDVCKSLGVINLSVSQPQPTRFLDSMFQHVAGFILTVDNLPSGASIEPVCSFAKGNVTCSVSCTAINATGGASCRITVPSMDYKTSPYYNSAAKLITLGGNVLNISVNFSNGPSIAARNFPFVLPDIVIEPTFHCGNNECEANLNENWENCCIDCACPGAEEYCYTGINLAGQCLNKNEIYLMHEGFPDRISCTIAQLGGGCVFVEPLDIDVHVVNPPSDMKLVSSMITTNNKSEDITCVKRAGQNYTCTTVLENIRNPAEGTTTIDAKLGFTISYTANKSARIQNISSLFTINVSRGKSDYVKSCEARINDIDDSIKKLERTRNLVKAILIAIVAIAATFTVICVMPPGHKWACTVALWLWCAAACVSGAMLPYLSDITSKVESMKTERAATCNTNNFGGVSSGNSESGALTTIIISAVLMIICTVCLLKAFGGSSSGGGTGASGGGSTSQPATSSGSGLNIA